MKRAAPLLILLLLPTTTAHPTEAPPRTTAAAVAAEVERVAAAGELWPGYAPLAIPLAVYDGERTWLFRHPAPPDGFAPVDGSQPAAFAMPGRHPAVTSNSSAEIGGTVTGTLLADGSRAEQTADALAAVALHEAFHVYQRAHHPGWIGNEGDLLRYPFENGELLALRRMETLALRRALAAEEPRQAACWAGHALVARGRRFAAMAPAFVAYERGNELNEGLATYVQLRARGENGVELPAGGWPASGLRDRFYAVGPAFALLLDHLRPGWQTELESDDTPSLDGLLSEAVAQAAAGDAGCGFAPGETEAMARRAADDAAAVVAARRERRQRFDRRPGRVEVIAAAGAPLWPQRFDPLNVERVEGGLLHTRYLRLGNDAGAVQIVDEAGSDLQAFTEAAGEHPLFNGVRRVVVSGLEGAEVENDEGTVRIRAPGLEFEFTGAAVERHGERTIVRLGGGG